MAQIVVTQMQGGKRPIHEARFGAMSEQAPSASEARLRLSDALLELAADSLEPVVVMPYPGEAFAVVWRSPRHGWTYTIRQPDAMVAERSAEDKGLHDHADRLVIRYSVGLNNGAERSRDGAEREARTHLAQWLYRPGRSTAWVAHPDDRRDALGMEAWQRAYRRGVLAGAVDPWAYANHEGSRGFPGDPGEEVPEPHEAFFLANGCTTCGLPPAEHPQPAFEAVVNARVQDLAAAIRASAGGEG